MVFLYSLVTPYNQHRYKCCACGHRWQAHHERGYPRLVIATYALGIPLLLFIAQSLYCQWCRIHCIHPPASCF